MELFDLSGKWNVELSDGTKAVANLPGTLDENSIGHKDRYSSKLYQDENYIENKSLSGSKVMRNNLFMGFFILP